MSRVNSLHGLSRGVRGALVAAVALLLLALGSGSWSLGLLGVALLCAVGWTVYSAGRNTARLDDLADPWPWPPDFRAAAEGMARPIDPTPRRVLPPDEKSSMIAAVATTDDAFARLLADKPPAWRWAVFTSVLLRRRDAAQSRLRRCVSGYQPRAGVAPLSGRAYSLEVYRRTTETDDVTAQLEQFVFSPAFTGVMNDRGEASRGDSDAVLDIANRLMDYHEAFLSIAEACLQTPIQPEARVFAQDMGALTLCPLVGYDRFIVTMCARLGEAQDLLPYTTEDTVVGLDNAILNLAAPHGLRDRIVAHVKEFNHT